MKGLFNGILDRYYGQREWLKDEHPETFKEQKHIEHGTSERAYWHHGYMMAIGDIFFGRFNGPEDLVEQVLSSINNGEDFSFDGDRYTAPSWYPKTTLEQRKLLRDEIKKERDGFYKYLKEKENNSCR